MGRESRCNTPAHRDIKNGTITSDSEDFNAIMQVVLCNKPIYRIGVTLAVLVLKSTKKEY